MNDNKIRQSLFTLARGIDRRITPEEASWDGTNIIWNEAKLGPAPILQDILDENLSEVKTDQLGHVAEARHEAEIGGITYLGKTFATDRNSQSKYTGIYIKAKEDPEFSILWKTVEGDFILLDATQTLALCDAVLYHVQTCFVTESGKRDLIMTATNEEEIRAITY